MCKCGKKLLLEITREDGKIKELSLLKDRDKGNVKFILGKRDTRTLRTWTYGLAYLYCISCNRKVQVRTFDTLEEYL